MEEGKQSKIKVEAEEIEWTKNKNTGGDIEKRGGKREKEKAEGET